MKISTHSQLAIHDFMPLPDNHLQYDSAFIHQTGSIVLGHHQSAAINQTTVLVGISNNSPELRKYLRTYHRVFESYGVNFVTIQPEELQLYTNKKILDTADFSSFNSTEQCTGTPFSESQQNPILNLLTNIFLEAIRLGAQDLHFERREYEGVIRVTIAARSKIFRRIDSAIFNPLINQIKILAGMNLLERKFPQDASFRFGVGHKKTDIRVSAIHTLHGESLSLRILLPLTSNKTLSELGYRDSTVRFLKHIVQAEHGLLLFCGPTGSGKSTSMNSLIREQNPDNKKIISIEDPIEIHNPQIEQIQVQEDCGLGFSQILKRVLRRNPDIILLGEIRDAETASLAVRAALSGHLIMSTLHCAEAGEAFSRLKSLGVAKHFQIAVIRGIIAQRLVENSEGKLQVKEELLIPDKRHLSPEDNVNLSEFATKRCFTDKEIARCKKN